MQCEHHDACGDVASMSRKVAKNAAWSVGGSIVSLLVGLAALALLLHTMGVARLGVFTLAIGLIGFSGVLDFGLGRALTQKVASDIGAERTRPEIAALVWKTLVMLACVGVVVGTALWIWMPLIVHSAFALQDELAQETINGLRMVALSLPMAMVAVGAAGVLEGLQEFRRVSLLRASLSIVQFGLPALVSLLTPDLGWVIAGLALSRVLSMVVWLWALVKLLPRPRSETVHREDVLHLFRFGGWLSVSNTVGPLMVYADRFYLASIFPPAAVAYYAVPLDSLFRATTLPVTAMAAVFPALAEQQSNPEKSVQLVRTAIIALVGAILPVAFLGSALAPQILRLWLGEDFASHAATIFQWLVLGIFINCVAHVPYALLQGHGRADITAKLHLFELPFFAVVLVTAVSHWGVLGAAIAWAARAALDTTLLYVVAFIKYPLHRETYLMGACWILVGVTVLLLPLLAYGWIWLGAGAVCVLALCVSALIKLRDAWQMGTLEVA